MVDASHQTWLNDAFDFLLTQELQDFEYYDNTIHLISLLVLSGNYWVPQGIPRTVNEALAVHPIINTFPNPFSSSITVSVSVQKNSNLTLTVTDICGKVRFRKEIEKTIGIYSETIDLKFLVPSIYLLKVETGEFQMVSRIIKHQD
jgi:hypothetical protein